MATNFTFLKEEFPQNYDEIVEADIIPLPHPEMPLCFAEPLCNILFLAL